nr:NUDIX hydrolase [Gammaproteobacteria bacterium]
MHVLVGIIEDAEGRVLVNQRRSGTPMAGFWEYPGGKRAPGEGPFDALRRELAEELGIEVHGASPWMELVHDYPGQRVRLDVWLVERWSGEPQGLEGQPLRWVPVDELADIGLLPADRPILDALVARHAARPGR